MTDKEIIDGLKEADACLQQYVKIVRLIAVELAIQKSEVVWGNTTSYDGDLGCYESGIDTICLHSAQDPISHDKDKMHKAFEFDTSWYDRIRKAGIKHISITGFF
jgi:hypothetical protein